MMQQFPMTIKNDVTAQKAHLTSYRTCGYHVGLCLTLRKSHLNPYVVLAGKTRHCHHKGVWWARDKRAELLRVNSSSTVATIKHHRLPRQLLEAFLLEILRTAGQGSSPSSVALFLAGGWMR